ncbi:MAG: PQQ-binding-like beta-propeller repeat protein [Pirellulales bacterium]
MRHTPLPPSVMPLLAAGLLCGWLPWAWGTAQRASAAEPVAAPTSDPTSAPANEAPADAWPVFRGCLAGTGRSAGAVPLPLAERWQRSLGKTAVDATPVIADGMIYVGDLDGTFHALALDDGAPRWTAKSENGFPSAAAVSTDPAVPVVVVGDGAGIVRAFDRRAGTVLWTHEAGGEISGGPTIVPGDDGPRVLIGSQDATLVCLRLADGKEVWKHTIGDQIRCSPTVADGRVLLAGCDGKLHAIDVATGTESGAVAIDGPTGTTPAAAAGRALFGSEGGVFWAIDVAANREAWRIDPTGSPQAYRSSAAVTGDLAVVGTRGRAVEAFAIADGTRRWRQPMRGRVDASPIVVGVAGAAAAGGDTAVIAADSAGRIVALDPASGTIRWQFDAGVAFTASPAVAAGRVVLADGKGTVWCFGAAPP